jgi:hypothetical protein
MWGIHASAVVTSEPAPSSCQTAETWRCPYDHKAVPLAYVSVHICALSITALPALSPMMPFWLTSPSPLPRPLCLLLWLWLLLWLLLWLFVFSVVVAVVMVVFVFLVVVAVVMVVCVLGCGCCCYVVCGLQALG